MCELYGEYFERCRCLVGITKLCDHALRQAKQPPLHDNYKPGSTTVCASANIEDLIYHHKCKLTTMICGRGNHRDFLPSKKTKLKVTDPTTWKAPPLSPYKHRIILTPTEEQLRIQKNMPIEVLGELNRDLDDSYGKDTTERNKYRPTYIEVPLPSYTNDGIITSILSKEPTGLDVDDICKCSRSRESFDWEEEC